MTQFFGSKKSATSTPATPARTASPTPEPTPIPGKVYQGMLEFEAWQPWDIGAARHKGTANNDYVKLPGPAYPKPDVPALVAKLTERGWRAGTRKVAGPSASTRAQFAAGGHRTGTALQRPPANPVSALRRGLGRPMLNNWQHLTLFDQVNAVAFRGDRRPPEAMKAAGGFYPPSTRLDDTYCRLIAEAFYKFLDQREGLGLDDMMKAFWIQDMVEYIQKAPTLEEQKFFREYHFWRALMDQEAVHLLGMTADSFMKGYISTTRDIGFAAQASTGSAGGRTGERVASGGWVYIVGVYGGFLLKMNVAGYTKDESEIAHLGPIPWDDVVGFFYYEPFNPQADMTLYFRKLFRVMHHPSFRATLAQVSGLTSVGRTPAG